MDFFLLYDILLKVTFLTHKTQVRYESHCSFHLNYQGTVNSCTIDAFFISII